MEHKDKEKQNDDQAHTPAGEVPVVKEEPPLDLVDPISLALMEEAVLAPCGHSFSKATIERWLQQNQKCPVCVRPITANSLAPNWALRSVIERFRGTTPDAGAGDDGGEMENDGGEKLGEDEKQMTAAPSTQPTNDDDHPQASAPPLQPDDHHEGDGDDDEESCIPKGEHSCCVWECNRCGVCVKPDEFVLWVLPTSALLCWLSFGKWSTWYSRTVCGVLYPIFLVLFLVTLGFDVLIYICVVWTILLTLASIVITLITLVKCVWPGPVPETRAAH